MPRRLGLLSLSLLLAGCPRGGAPATIHVDAAAAAGGDGSAARPFTTIGEALAEAADGASVLVAPGDYPETLQFAVREVTVAGDGGRPAVGDGSVPALTVEAGARVELRSLALLGLDVRGSQALAQDVVLGGAGGVALSGQGAVLELEGVDLRGAVAQLSGGSLLARELVAGDVEGTALDLVDVDAVLLGPTIADVAAEAEGQGIGIASRGGSLLVQGGSVAGVATRGLHVVAGLLDVRDASLSGIGLTAIAFSADAEWNRSAGMVADCEFTDNATDVMADGSDVVVRGNHFAGSRTFGVVGSSGGTVRADGNHFEGLGGTAVALIAPLASTITSNVIEGADEGGISVQQSGAQVAVAWNEIRGVRAAGVSFSWASDALVAYNVIADVQLDLAFQTLGEGISIMDASGRIFGNEITGVAGIGINLVRVDGDVDDNVIAGSGGGGIQVSGTGLHPPLRLSGNDATEGSGFGLLAMEADVVVTDGRFGWSDYNADGFGDGIALMTDTRADLLGNTCQGSAGSGIMVIDNVLAQIDDNNLVENGVYGIWVHCASEPLGVRASSVTLGQNEFEGNWLGEVFGCY